MILKRCLGIILPGLMLILLSGQSAAQVFPRGNGLSLSGLTQIDLHVQVASWQDIATDPFAFRLQVQGMFESRLKAAGIKRQPANRDYLVCKLQAIQTRDLVAYTTSLEYWGLRSTDVHTLLWENSAIATASHAEFKAERIAEECVNSFLDEWSKWNPPS